MEWLRDQLNDDARNHVLRLLPITHSLSLPVQFAIAWCLKNPRVSNVVFGASRLEQLRDMLDSLAALPKSDAVAITRTEHASGGF